MVWTDEEICNAIDDLRADRRATTIEAIGEKLGVDDLEALNARLLQAAKDNLVWMLVIAWEGDADVPQFAYQVRRGSADDDLSI